MQPTNSKELLAPAGNIESFFAALDAGADAVYLGLKNFSARGRARNFSIKDLEKLIPYAHGHSQKVYVAMNTILKESELDPAIGALAALSDLQVDAVIIQDLGLCHLIKKHFPKLPIHASTQMTVHNSAGVIQLGEMGFDRVVLAREMTLEEIGQVRKKTSVALEAFVQGSMCFSYAGSCFFSSYLGGKSSNRGVCSQPCRREFRDSGQDVNPFSMGDLSAIELMPQLLKSGVDSFKIEGRMKSVEYVESVVKAYRMVIDASPVDQKDAIEKAKGLLKPVTARQRTTGFFLDERPTSITLPGRSGNVGRYAGKVVSCKKGRASFNAGTDLHLRDRLRVQNVKTGGRVAFSLNDLWVKGRKVKEVKKGAFAEIAVPHKLNPGDTLFMTTSHQFRGKNVSAARRLGSMKGSPLSGGCGKLASKVKRNISAEMIAPPAQKAKGGLMVRVAELGEVYGIIGQCEAVSVPLARANIHNIRKHLKRLRSMKEKLVWSLPLVIQEGDVPMYNDVIDFLIHEGFLNWQISNIGHFYMFKGRNVDLSTSQYLHALNSQAVIQLQELGCSRINISIESDRDNLALLVEKGVAGAADLLVYSHLPLYVSRVKWEKKQRRGYGGEKGEQYFLKERDGLTYVYSEKPFSFLGYIKLFKKMGFRNFQIDLSAEGRDKEAFRSVLGSFKKGVWTGEGSAMNMEVGLE